ncbi:MAG TPA: extracellular solute-binding protein [Firmicutes bacterium]|nr:extracellular solute-binding protein [Bacillota bacterium]
MKRIIPLVVLIATMIAMVSVTASAKTINIWTGFPELEPFYKWAGAEFAKSHPGVNFQVLSTSLREFEQKLTAAIPTGTGPDVFDVGPYIAIKLIDAGLLPPNPPEVDAHLKGGAWSKFSVDYVTIGGKTYGIPLMNGSRAALFYNKKMFREAGLDPNSPPATFPDLLQAATKLTKYDSAGNVVRSGHSMRISGGGSGLTEKFRFVLHNAGGDVIVPTGGGKWRNDLDNEAGQRALQYYIDSIHKYKVDDPQVRHDSEAFVTESTAMFLRESWVIGEIKSKNPKLEYGVAPMPKWERWDTLAQPWSVYMSAEGAKSKEVREFINFLTGKEAAAKLVELSGWIPDRLDFDWQSLVKKTPQYQVFVNPPKGMGFFADPVMPAFDEVQTKVADRLVEAFLDKKLVNNQEGIKRVVHEIGGLIDSILKRYGAYGK